MSAISQKSISGITSITTPAGVDNVFTVHTNDTTERFRVDSNGNQVIAGILTASNHVFITAGDLVINDVISHFGDGNTKIRFPADDTISFETAGSERLRITSDGKVGIGTDNPSQALDVNGKIKVFGSDGTAYGLVISPDSSGGTYEHLIAKMNGDLRIQAGSGTYQASNANILLKNTTDHIIINAENSGRVGIHTNNPQAQLHISGTGQNTIRVDSSGQAISFYNHTEFIGYIGNESGKLFINAGGTEDTLLLKTNGSERLRISKEGNVGIGTNSPAKALEVTSNTVPQFQVGMSNNSARASLMHNGYHLYFDTTSGDQVFRTGSTSERLRITNDGVGINTSSLNHLFEVHALGNDANNLQQIVFEKKSSANNKQAFGLTIRSNAQTSSGNEPTAFLKFDARPSSLNGSHGGNAIIAFSPIGVTQGTYGKGNLDFYLRSGGPYTFQNDPGGAGEMQPKLRIDPEGRVMMGGATSAHGSTNRDDLVIGAVNQANQTGITIGSASASGISFADAGNDTAGGIYYSHGNDDMIFYAGGNQRGKVKDDSGVTGIEHHRFIPFLIGYNVQNTENITMSKGFGGMSQLPMNADGDKAYMSYVTHWRHRQYAGVYFWYGASGNTSGATFDWDFTVWNAGSGQGYSASSHTFTITSGTMSNGKMYRLSALSSWPTHAASKFVQFEIDFDELQNGTSLQLSGMELAEYTTP